VAKKDKKANKQNAGCKGGFSKGGRCICGKGKKKVGGVCVNKNGKNQKKTCKGGLALSSGKCRCGMGKKDVNGACVKIKKNKIKKGGKIKKIKGGKKKKVPKIKKIKGGKKKKIPKIKKTKKIGKRPYIRKNRVFKNHYKNIFKKGRR